MGDVSMYEGNYRAGGQIAQMAIDWIAANPDHFGSQDKVEIAVINNYDGEEMNLRGQGILDTLAKEDNITIIAEKEATGVEAGMQYAENLASSNPNCEIVCDISDDSGIGVVEAWKASNRDSTFAGVFGMDATPGAVEIIKAGGAFRGSVYQDQASQTPVVASSLIKLALGHLKEGDMGTPDVIKITPENVYEYFPD
jgi:ABC-type sugar transport system substrate-binding protein